MARKEVTVTTAKKRSPAPASAPAPKRAIVGDAGRRQKTSAANWVQIGRVLALAAALFGLGWGAKQAWRTVGPSVIRQERFLLTSDHVTITPQPEWLMADVRGQVLRNAAIDQRLSLLDEGFFSVVHDAFTLHPWVEKVERIEKRYPPALRVELVYRQPVAVIETRGPAGTLLSPIDRAAIRLPSEDVPEIRLRYLPRIGNIANSPPTGQPWDDPRVTGGVDLAIRLASVWEPLFLDEIVPSAHPEIRGDHRYYVYDLIARGGTRIVWGAAPSAQAEDEPDFHDKLRRLQLCIEQIGPLDTVRSPGVVDVRRELQISPR